MPKNSVGRKESFLTDRFENSAEKSYWNGWAFLRLIKILAQCGNKYLTKTWTFLYIWGETSKVIQTIQYGAHSKALGPWKTEEIMKKRPKKRGVGYQFRVFFTHLGVFLRQTCFWKCSGPAWRNFQMKSARPGPEPNGRDFKHCAA